VAPNAKHLKIFNIPVLTITINVVYVEHTDVDVIATSFAERSVSFKRSLSIVT
jgi:hypothetical protein